MPGTVTPGVAQAVSPDGGRLERMGKQELVAEILSLPVEERMEVAEAIWASISAVPDALPLTDWQREELDRRLAEMDADPDGGLTMEEVFAAIRRGK
jgi:putative addiction module component (TIGR02574 family)